MKKAMKRKTVERNGKKKSLFSIWLGVWIPLFSIILLTIAVLTGLWYSVAEDELTKEFETEVETIFTADWEAGTDSFSKAYRKEQEKGEKSAEEFVNFALEAKINLLWSTGIYGILYDTEGNIVTTTNKTVYFGYKDKSDDEKAYLNWYQCENSKIIEEICKAVGKYKQEEYDNYQFDEVYVNGRTFLPAKMIFYKDNKILETVSFSLEDENLSSYTHMEHLLVETKDGSIDLEPGKMLVSVCGYDDPSGEYSWDEEYLEYLKGIKNPQESETYAYYEHGFNEEEAQSYQKLTVGGKDYYLFFGEKYHPFSYIKGDVGMAALIGVIFSVIFALILSANFYRIYRRELMLQKRQRDFSNALAHDLKTPLMAISGYAENLAENIYPEKKEHYIEGIQSNVSYMNALIGQIMEMAKTENPDFSLHKTQIALQEITQKILNLYEGLAEKKDITIHMSGTAQVVADASCMERVMENLIKNALEYTPEHQSIFIKMDENQLEVTNTGIEIPKEKLEEIWKPFIKGDESRSRKQGHGLGLSIVKNILELHGFPCEMISEKNQVTVRIFFKKS